MNELTCKTEEVFLERLDSEYLEWGRQIGLELIKGIPLSEDSLAERLGITGDKVREIIDAFHNVERNDEGDIVGLAGFTLRPTRHRCRINDRVFYVWCAGDALGFPVLLDKTTRVESACYATGRAVELTVTPDRIEQLDPESTVVSIVVPEELPEDIRGFYCDRVNFFESETAADRWRTGNEDGIVLPVREAYRYYRTMTHRILNEQTNG